MKRKNTTKFLFSSDFIEKNIWYEPDDFKNFFFKLRKKKFDEKMFEKCSKFFFVEIFFLWAGASTPGPLPGLRPWTPHAFGLRTLVGTGSRSMEFQQKISTFFLWKVFFFKLIS